MAMLQRRKNPDHGEQAGAEIGQRHAAFIGDARLARDRHDAGDACAIRSNPLGAAGARFGRSRRSTRRSGAVDLSQRLVTKAERVHHARP